MPVHSVHSQSANHNGIEGIHSSLSRFHSTWYMQSTSSGNVVAPIKSSWEDSLQPSQQTPAIAERTAKMWLGREKATYSYARCAHIPPYFAHLRDRIDILPTLWQSIHESKQVKLLTSACTLWQSSHGINQ